MKQMKLGTSSLMVSNIALGCMRMAKLSTEEAKHTITAALDTGIQFFDHADIYGQGESERIFAAATKELGIRREEIILQSKCGIRKGCFDFSQKHILQAVDGILERLDTSYLDVLLLHRPDTLFEPAEVAETFDMLYQAGKVKHFGVSNQNPGQIALLKKYCKQDLVANQLQYSIMHTGMIDAGINVNMKHAHAVDYDGGILEYSRLHDMTIQAWSPFQYGFFEGVFLDHERFPELNAVIDEIAKKYQVKNTAIAVSWILTHPAQMQVVIGTMNPTRIADIAAASELRLTREEWYAIYLAAGNKLP